jgi:hypothetical protein
MPPRAEGESPCPRSSLHTVALDALPVGAAFFLALVWFSERLTALPLTVPLAGMAVCVLAWWLRMGRRAFADAAGDIRSCLRWRPHWETGLCLLLAVASRLPAILHPWAWANREAAYAGFPALRICASVRPGPVFAEGAPYMGTLKGHLAAALALLTRSADFSLLLVLTSLFLYAVCIAATMSVARRIAGRAAAIATGLYLALSPPFVTVFSVNSLGQYVDLLALGGLSLALLARLLDERLSGRASRGWHFAIGLTLGVAFWQQPLAVVYIAVVTVAYLLRARRVRDPWSWYAVAGFCLGVFPVAIWNWEHAGATSEVVARTLTPLSQAPALLHRLSAIALPLLMGAGRHVPLAQYAAVRVALMLAVPGLAIAFAIRSRRALRDALAGAPTAALLPLLLLLSNGIIVVAAIHGSQYERPRYVLPAVTATAIHLGVVIEWVWLRWRWLAVGALGVIVAWNAVGTLTRPFGGAKKEAFYRQLIAVLDAHGLCSGYADFSIAHPVTLFTAERILLSPRLGPTRAWESPRHAQRIGARGVDAIVLRPQDDPRALAQRLRELHVGFHLLQEPTPLFFGFSRPVTIEELSGQSSLADAEEDVVLPQ